MNRKQHDNIYYGTLIRLRQVLRLSVLGLAIAGLTGTAAAEEFLFEFSGEKPGLTDEFEIEGPWLLDWHVTSDFPHSAGIEINLVDGVFLSHKGLVLIARDPGAGTKLFYDSGSFRFRIISNAIRWRLRVSKISEEEAERMIRK